MINLLLFLHTIMVIALTLRVLYRDDVTGSARLGWFITFTTLPGIGSGIYLLFGELYISRRLITRHAQAIAQLPSLGPAVTGDPTDALDDVALQHRNVFHYAQTINGFGPLRGNKVELLRDAADFVEHLIRDIDAADTSVSILYYIWLSDTTGTRVAEALIRAAQRGVTCRVMVDELGSRKLIRDPLWSRMQQAGVDCAVAMPLEKLYAVRVLNRFDLRNHRKITVIDGKIAYCGSQNCADPEFREKPAFAPWVDIMTRLQGPVVNQMQALFAMDWAASHEGSGPRDFVYAAEPVKNGIRAQVRGTGPLKRRFSAVQSVTSAISSARESLHITTPYFVPDMTTLNAICKAALSGVNVTLTVPARNDSYVVYAASRSHYRLLLDAGVTIYEYRPGLLHAKIMTIDGVLSVIGSSNLDLRSFDLNYENDLLIYDTEVTAQIRQRQQSYIAEANQIDPEDVTAWSTPRRILYNVIGTLGPIL